MAGRIAKARSWVLAHGLTPKTLGYWIGALFLVPAAAIVSLYPLNWFLGDVAFAVGTVDIAPIRPYLIVPILLGVAIARLEKSWVLGVLVVPGVLLMLSAPDRLGAYRPDLSNTEDYYPETYSAARVIDRIEALKRSIEKAGEPYRLLPPELPGTLKVAAMNAAAGQAVGLWKAVSADEPARLKLKAEIDALVVAKARLPNNMFKQVQAKAIDGQIKQKTDQLAKLKAAPAGSAGAQYVQAAAATSAVVVELNLMERWTAEKIAFIDAIPYLLSASLAFAVILCVVGFRTSTMAVLLGATAGVSLWAALPLSVDDQLVDASIVLYPAFVATMSAVVLRFFFRAIKDNAALTEVFRNGSLVRAGVMAAVVWLPFPAILYGVFWLNALIYDTVSAAIYCDRNVFAICGSLATPPVQDSDPTRDTLHDDINATIQRRLAEFETQAVNAAEGGRTNVAREVAAAKARILGIYDSILPPHLYQIFPDLEPPGCDWWKLEVSKCAKRMVLQKLDDAYGAPVSRWRQRLDNRLGKIAAEVTGRTINGADEFRAAVKGESREIAKYATKLVDAGFIALSVFSILQMTLMTLVTMRAYLLCFGRMLDRELQRKAGRAGRTPALATGADPHVTLTHLEPAKQAVAATVAGIPADMDGQLLADVDEKVAAAASARAPADIEVQVFKNTLKLCEEEHLPLLTKRRCDVDGADQPTLLIPPRFWRWPFRRFANGCLFLKKVSRLPDKDCIEFTAGENHHFVIWNIPAGREVFFRWAEFAAMSASATLRKTISLRLGGLTMGTTMLPSIVGPGYLIQISHGEVELAHKVTDGPSVRPSRIRSWEAGARFRIRAPSGLCSIYLDPSSLEVSGGEKAAIDADDGTGGRWGVAKEFVSLFRP